MRGFKLQFLHFIVSVTVLVQGLRPWFLTRLDLLFIFAEYWDSAVQFQRASEFCHISSSCWFNSLSSPVYSSLPSSASPVCTQSCLFIFVKIWCLSRSPSLGRVVCGSSLSFACFHVCSPFPAQSFLSLSFVSLSWYQAHVWVSVCLPLPVLFWQSLVSRALCLLCSPC